MTVHLSKTVAELKHLSDEQLAQHMAYHKVGAPDYLLSQMEFQRRQNRWPERRSWIAVGISTFALVASFASLALRSCS